MLTIFAVIVVFSFVILVHELGHFIAARRIGVRVEKFALGFGKTLFSTRRGETEYCINVVPFGGYVKMAGEEQTDKHEGKAWEFLAKPHGKRFWVLFSGAAVNYLFAFLIFCFVLPTTHVIKVVENLPAEKAGMQADDRVLSIDGERIWSFSGVIDAVSKNKEADPLLFQIEREGKVLEFEITPTLAHLEGEGGERFVIGVKGADKFQVLKRHPLEYLRAGASQSFYITTALYKFLWRLITGKESLKKNVAGPVGIAVIIGHAARAGVLHLLWFMGYINAVLAIFNLLPFPILDGGHILFLGLEKLRRRPLSLKAQEIMNNVALALILVFFVFVTWNDLMNFVDWKAISGIFSK